MTTKTKPKLNVKLLRRIQKHILEEPRRFFMSGMALKAKNQSGWEARAWRYFDISKEMPPCGTAACIAGWANILSGRPRRGLHGAAKELGVGIYINALGYKGTEYANRVFVSDDWPEPYATQYEKAKTPRKRARVAANRIEHLIKTGE